jgi:hypothetical protein
VAGEAGRRLSPHTAEGYNEKNLTAFSDAYYRPELFGALDRLVEAGKIR